MVNYARTRVFINSVQNKQHFTKRREAKETMHRTEKTNARSIAVHVSIYTLTPPKQLAKKVLSLSREIMDTHISCDQSIITSYTC